MADSLTTSTVFVREAYYKQNSHFKYYYILNKIKHDFSKQRIKPVPYLILFYYLTLCVIHYVLFNVFLANAIVDLHYCPNGYSLFSTKQTICSFDRTKKLQKYIRSKQVFKENGCFNAPILSTCTNISLIPSLCIRQYLRA